MKSLNGSDLGGKYGIGSANIGALAGLVSTVAGWLDTGINSSRWANMLISGFGVLIVPA